MSKQLIRLTVNGDTHEIAVSSHHTLLDVLRNDLGMTGTKRGCTAGSCGVCTVNGEKGEAICSCLTLAIEWDGRSVTTIEGIEEGNELHPVQAAFLEYGAVQCGHWPVQSVVAPGISRSRRRYAGPPKCFASATQQEPPEESI
jgi:aerobic-type carbon monoxide dehydrogenase small subunit (CoxS/CutS family)